MKTHILIFWISFFVLFPHGLFSKSPTNREQYSSDSDNENSKADLGTEDVALHDNFRPRHKYKANGRQTRFYRSENDKDQEAKAPQCAVMYKDSEPVGILQPFKDSYKFLPVSGDPTLVDINPIPVKRKSIMDVLYPSKINEDYNDEVAENNNQFADDRYPSIFAKFKIDSRLDKSMNPELNLKRSMFKRDTERPDISDEQVSSLKTTLSKMKEDNSAVVEEELKNILDDMGLIDDYDEKEEVKREVAEDENMEQGTNKINLIKEVHNETRNKRGDGNDTTESVPIATTTTTTTIAANDSDTGAPQKKAQFEEEHTEEVESIDLFKADDAKLNDDSGKEDLDVTTELEESRKKRQFEENKEEAEDNKDDKRDAADTLQDLNLNTSSLVKETELNQYEKRVEREIRDKIQKLKEEVKEEIKNLKDTPKVSSEKLETRRRKRQAVNTLIDEETQNIDPTLNDVQQNGEHHVRRKRSLDFDDSRIFNESEINDNTIKSSNFNDDRKKERPAKREQLVGLNDTSDIKTSEVDKKKITSSTLVNEFDGTIDESNGGLRFIIDFGELDPNIKEVIKQNLIDEENAMLGNDTKKLSERDASDNLQDDNIYKNTSLSSIMTKIINKGTENNETTNYLKYNEEIPQISEGKNNKVDLLKNMTYTDTPKSPESKGLVNNTNDEQHIKYPLDKGKNMTHNIDCTDITCPICHKFFEKEKTLQIEIKSHEAPSNRSDSVETFKSSNSNEELARKKNIISMLNVIGKKHYKTKKDSGNNTNLQNSSTNTIVNELPKAKKTVPSRKTKVNISNYALIKRGGNEDHENLFQSNGTTEAYDDKIPDQIDNTERIKRFIGIDPILENTTNFTYHRRGRSLKQVEENAVEAKLEDGIHVRVKRSGDEDTGSAKNNSDGRILRRKRHFKGDLREENAYEYDDPGFNEEEVDENQAYDDQPYANDNGAVGNIFTSNVKSTCNCDKTGSGCKCGNQKSDISVPNIKQEYLDYLVNPSKSIVEKKSVNHCNCDKNGKNCKCQTIQEGAQYPEYAEERKSGDLDEDGILGEYQTGAKERRPRRLQQRHIGESRRDSDVEDLAEDYYDNYETGGGRLMKREAKPRKENQQFQNGEYFVDLHPDVYRLTPLETSRKKRDNKFNNLVALHGGGPAVNHLVAIRRQRSMLPHLRFRRRVQVGEDDRAPRQLIDMSDEDLFGALPQSFAGELARYRVMY